VQSVDIEIGDREVQSRGNEKERIEGENYKFLVNQNHNHVVLFTGLRTNLYFE